MIDILDELFLLLNIFIAIIISGTVGLEREFARKPAGLRTHMIVGGSVALIVHLGYSIISYYQNFSEQIQADPTRVIQAIIVGISFIGAGTVLQVKENNMVRNLTSAASILLSVGIGIGVAIEKYVLSIGVAVFAILINYLARVFENKFLNKKKKYEKNK
ncbi:MAG: MgtC/SapB family protein [Cyclobacteriaceae bacterium]